MMSICRLYIWSDFGVLSGQIIDVNEGGIFNPPHFLFCVKTFADRFDGQVNHGYAECTAEKTSEAQ